MVASRTRLLNMPNLHLRILYRSRLARCLRYRNLPRKLFQLQSLLQRARMRHQQLMGARWRKKAAALRVT